MKKTSVIAALSVAAALVLSAAAVWMGALNQDEGWYLYAANLVSEGKVPYRDFFYTQGPLLPLVYSAFTPVWKSFGLLGARLFTLALGLMSIVFFCATARRLAGKGAAAIVFLLLATNLYHLYYLAIPKTYALASLFVAVGFWLYSIADDRLRRQAEAVDFVRLLALFGAAMAIAFAAGARISLGVILPVVGLALLYRAVREKKCLPVIAFAAGGALALALVYGPFVFDESAVKGLVLAQKYHAARGGFDPVWTVGSLSRLVRWYLPIAAAVAVIIFLRLESGAFRLSASLPLFAFLAVFALQMSAPFPYEDYQVPVMGLLAVWAAANLVRFPIMRCLVVVMFVSFAASFGSPLLEKWAPNGQDRFWSLKKTAYELPQLREAARTIEQLDPGGKELFTQDLYLAIETDRKVPGGLEMGPFSMLNDDEWHKLLETADAPVAALSGYSFAIEPPVCNERSVEKQLEYWSILKKRYTLAGRIDNFGQGATTLLILKRNAEAKAK